MSTLENHVVFDKESHTAELSQDKLDQLGVF